MSCFVRNAVGNIHLDCFLQILFILLILSKNSASLREVFTPFSLLVSCCYAHKIPLGEKNRCRHRRFPFNRNCSCCFNWASNPVCHCCPNLTNGNNTSRNMGISPMETNQGLEKTTQTSSSRNSGPKAEKGMLL